jgi:hypothetical protein
VIDSVTGTTPGPAVERGQPFDVTVHVVDADGNPTTVPAGATVDVALSRYQGTGNLNGGTTTGQISQNESGTTISGVVYSVVENHVKLQASGTLTPPGTALTPGVSAEFTVFDQFVEANLSPGQNTTLTTSPNGQTAPCDTDTKNLVCITVNLPNGANTFILQEGACDTADACLGSALSGILGSLKDAAGNPLYSATSPLRYSIEFDKSITRNRSPNDVVIEAMFDDQTTFHFVENCKTPGVVNPGIPPFAHENDCVDRRYRDGSADTIIEVILFGDWISRGH